jgi:membrane protease YdiL (CAAX protease family)
VRAAGVLFGALVVSALVLSAAPGGLAWAETQDRHPVSRTLEPTEYGYAEPGFMTWLLAAGLVLLVLWERTEREPGPGRTLFSPWQAEDVLLAIAAFVLGLILFGALVRACHFPDMQVWMPPVVMSLCGVSTCLLVLFHVNRRYGLVPADLGLRFDRWRHDLLLAAGMLVFVFGLQVLMSGYVHYLYERAREPLERQSVIQQMLEERSAWRLAVMVVVAVVVAPVWEEIAFRGFLQPFLRRRLGGTGSIVLTAVLFSLIHEPLSKFLAVPLFVFPLALALGYCYERTQRLAAPILLHMLHNLVSVIAVLAARGLS